MTPAALAASVNGPSASAWNVVPPDSRMIDAETGAVHALSATWSSVAALLLVNGEAAVVLMYQVTGVPESACTQRKGVAPPSSVNPCDADCSSPTCGALPRRDGRPVTPTARVRNSERDGSRATAPPTTTVSRRLRRRRRSPLTSGSTSNFENPIATVRSPSGPRSRQTSTSSPGANWTAPPTYRNSSPTLPPSSQISTVAPSMPVRSSMICRVVTV